MKKYSCILLTFFLSVDIFAQDIPKVSFDGRFGSQCIAFSRNSKEGVCIAPFQRVLVNPEKYNHKLISLTGFLVNSFGRPVLFPSSESYKSDMQFEGIELMGKLPLDKKVMDGMDKGVFPIRVVGIFDATYQGADVFRLGAIKNISSITLHQIIPER
ncbi:hypothetical protein [Rhodanobacter thiooxydans]|uniref:hypothetical protein n=1 Tax=Rhodanobacter thiooxydans TaxID=416169 RepID=UPI001290241D|nr:hypothetical protein [Rhodanobacter thiooxydans]